MEDVFWEMYWAALFAKLINPNDKNAPLVLNSNVPPIARIMHAGYVAVLGQIVMFGPGTERQ